MPFDLKSRLQKIEQTNKKLKGEKNTKPIPENIDRYLQETWLNISKHLKSKNPREIRKSLKDLSRLNTVSKDIYKQTLPSLKEQQEILRNQYSFADT